jgi:hypothetical protein
MVLPMITELDSVRPWGIFLDQNFKAGFSAADVSGGRWPVDCSSSSSFPLLKPLILGHLVAELPLK